MNYIEQCQQAINQIVDEEYKAVKAFIEREIQAPTVEELNRMAFDKSLQEVHTLEHEAGLD